jgi:hypothetical protein
MPKTTNPARGEAAGLGNVIVLAGSDTRVNTAPPTDPQLAMIVAAGLLVAVVYDAAILASAAVIFAELAEIEAIIIARIRIARHLTCSTAPDRVPS